MDDFPKIIDSHTHLQFSAFDADRKEVISRALQAGIWVVNAGSNSVNSGAAIRLAEEYDKGVYATVGIHPLHAGNGNDKQGVSEEEGEEIFNHEKMKALAVHPKVVAIGECGLDYFHRDESSKKAEEEMFVSHIKIAHEVGKPLVIHCRDAYSDLLNILLSNKGLLLNNDPGLAHFFSGSVDEARDFLDLGFSFSFGGAITLPPRAGGCDFSAVMRFLPKDRITLETDAPWVTPLKYRGKRNESFYISEVAVRAGEILGISSDDFCRMATENALRIFRLNW